MKHLLMRGDRANNFRKEQKDAEVAIIGAGPIGIELALSLKKYDIPYIHFDKGQIGQTIYDYPPQTHFFSSSERIAIDSIPIQTINQQKCTREEYLAYLRTCVLEHQLHIYTFEEATAIHKISHGENFNIETISAAGKRGYCVPYVVLSTGGTAKSRMLNIPGENLPHVSSKLKDPHLYFQKKIVIIGSRNSSVEWSLRCFHAGANVKMISRRQMLDPAHVKYWLLPELKSLATEKQIECIFNAEVIEILPDAIKLANHQGETSIIKADFVVKAIGFESDMTLFKKMGIKLLENEVPNYDPKTMETNIRNVFVMGTATGGTQVNFKVFIENCHVHVHRILEAIGKRANIKMKRSRENVQVSFPEE